MFVSATILGTLLLAVFAVIFGLKAIENHLETPGYGSDQRADRRRR